MSKPFNEGRRTVNNIPLSVECLLMADGSNVAEFGNQHYHEYIELLYPIRGNYKVALGGRVLDLPERSMVIINSSEPHATLGVSSGERLLFCIKFMPQILYSSEQSVTELEYIIPYILENPESRRLFLREQLENTYLPEIFSEIIGEQSEKRFGYELMTRALVLKIFAWVIRFWHERGGIRLPDGDDSAVKTVAKARKYVAENYTDATLSSAAKFCGLSYSYFSRLFNRVMRMSFSDYVNLVRVNNSMKMLTVSDLSITEIALACGFSSTSYYIQTFKRLKYISPSRFRKMIKIKVKKNLR